MPTSREIAEWLNELLDLSVIEDESCNGLQVENEGQIQKVAFAVDACYQSYSKAVLAGAQMLVVHHGMIWGGLKAVTDHTYQNIKFLINHNLALYACHLPLDLHPVYGNNAQLADLLNLRNRQKFGTYHNVPIGFIGEVEDLSLDNLREILRRHGMKDLILPFGPSRIRRIAVVSGGAAGEVVQAAEAGADCYITGEPLHHVQHLARELGIHVIFAGHYETETWGVRALMQPVSEKFHIDTEFLELETLI
ncbi:MAG: Nif3-like dinuclear metal center hexameric protein [Lentisphaerae bacterium]|nr:MAG: Nif3-like dinuclear metal center hexameric protein [Lentisphaerota bacterium]